MIKRLAQRIPAATASLSAVFAALMIYYSTLAHNYMLKETGVDALPRPTALIIWCAKNHLFSALAAISVILILVAELKIQTTQNRLLVQLVVATVFLVLTSISFLGMSLPFTCMCNDWRRW